MKDDSYLLSRAFTICQITTLNNTTKCKCTYPPGLFPCVGIKNVISAYMDSYVMPTDLLQSSL